MKGRQKDRAGPFMAFIAGHLTRAKAPFQHGTRHAPGPFRLCGNASRKFLRDEGGKSAKQRFQQRFLGGEVIQQAAFGNPGFARGSFERQRGNAAGDDQVFSRIQNARGRISDGYMSIHAL